MNYDFRTTPQYPRSLIAALGTIQDGQLIRRSEEDDAESSSAAYIFKHVLVQDTAYSSLMRQDRKRLHGLVAHALESVYPERTNEFAPVLAAHFEEAGELERALRYLEQAAQDASARYADREALGFYARALDIAERLESGQRDSLYRARGVIYERRGEFDAACSDLEKALRLARAAGDDAVAWQSLMDLGFAWLARDYARAGEYFEKALELARGSQDAARTAHTLNRVGNWYLNYEDPERALAYHGEALSIFRSLADQRGIAETQDLLGMSSLIASNYFDGVEHFQRAVELYTALGDLRGAAGSLTALFLNISSLQTDLLVLPPPSGGAAEMLDRLLQSTRDLGLRAAEVFVLWVAGEAFASAGWYGRGLELERQAIAFAQEIGHRQWLAAATMLQGAIFADLLDYMNAESALVPALALSRQVGSIHWTRFAAGFLSSSYVAQGKLDQAQATLDTFTPESVAPKTIGQRQSWKARIELSLARHDPEHALWALDLMFQHTPNLTPDTVIPALWILRALAFLQLDRAPEAERTAQAAHSALRERYQARLMWRVEGVLSRIYRAQRRQGEATRHANAAQEIVEQLAQTVDDEALRQTFVTGSRAWIQGEATI